MIVLQNINKGFESCTMIYIFFNHSLLPTKIKLWFATVRYMYTISLRIYKKSDFLFKIRLRNVSMVYEKKYEIVNEIVKSFIENCAFLMKTVVYLRFSNAKLAMHDFTKIFKQILSNLNLQI